MLTGNETERALVNKITELAYKRKNDTFVCHTVQGLSSSKPSIESNRIVCSVQYVTSCRDIIVQVSRSTFSDCEKSGSFIRFESHLFSRQDCVIH